MKYIIDLHTHTISSGHAYSTLEENARIAKLKGIEILGMSDHAPNMPGAPHIFHFNNLKIIPDHIDTVRVLKGVEVNIINSNGDLDIDENTLESLDYAIASLHPPCIEPSNIVDNTNAIITAIKNPHINIIGHPDDGRYPIDYEKMVLAAKEFNTLIELNNSSLSPKGFRLNTIQNSERILRLCKQHKVSIILSSDAHFSSAIGDFSRCLDLIKTIGFPNNLIVNTSIENLKKFVEIK